MQQNWSHHVKEISIPAATRTQCWGVPYILSVRARGWPGGGNSLLSFPSREHRVASVRSFVIRFYLYTKEWVKMKMKTNGECVGTGLCPNISFHFGQQVGNASDRLQNHLVVREQQHQQWRPQMLYAGS